LRAGDCFFAAATLHAINSGWDDKKVSDFAAAAFAFKAHHTGRSAYEIVKKKFFPLWKVKSRPVNVLDEKEQKLVR